jgi:hypothetical protein
MLGWKMATPTPEIERLLELRRQCEEELRSIDGDRQRLSDRETATRKKLREADQALAIALGYPTFTTGLSIRQAIPQILKQAGETGLTVEEIHERVVKMTNKGTLPTVVSYLEQLRAEQIPNTNRWRLRS